MIAPWEHDKKMKEDINYVTQYFERLLRVQGKMISSLCEENSLCTGDLGGSETAEECLRRHESEAWKDEPIC